MDFSKIEQLIDTMPQRGISQAIELNVNEIEGKQKELLDGVL